MLEGEGCDLPLPHGEDSGPAVAMQLLLRRPARPSPPESVSSGLSEVGSGAPGAPRGPARAPPGGIPPGETGFRDRSGQDSA